LRRERERRGDQLTGVDIIVNVNALLTTIGDVAAHPSVGLHEAAILAGDVGQGREEGVVAVVTRVVLEDDAVAGHCCVWLSESKARERELICVNDVSSVVSDSSQAYMLSGITMSSKPPATQIIAPAFGVSSASMATISRRSHGHLVRG
jgi:hypothetical protein